MLPNPEDRLFDLLEQQHGDEAHSRYNALTRRLVSFERRAAGRAAEHEGVCYLTGGATAVLLGWRGSTVDIDVRFEPDQLKFSATSSNPSATCN